MVRIFIIQHCQKASLLVRTHIPKFHCKPPVILVKIMDHTIKQQLALARGESAASLLNIASELERRETHILSQSGIGLIEVFTCFLRFGGQVIGTDVEDSTTGAADFLLRYGST
jgi:hypothetical protein